MSKTYQEKLRDPRWQKKRLRILERDEFSCQKCQDTESTLHIHHKEYIYGNDPWDYNDNYLVTLCENCHKSEEHYKEEVSGIIHDMRIMGFTNEHIYVVLNEYVKEHREDIEYCYGKIECVRFKS